MASGSYSRCAKAGASGAAVRALIGRAAKDRSYCIEIASKCVSVKPDPVFRGGTCTLSDQPDHTRPLGFEDTILSEGEALAVWSRAAQLQGEADTPIAHAAENARAQPTAAVALAEGTRAPAGMYLVREIVAAAGDAGIAETHVRVALAEHDALGHELALAVEAIDEGVRERLIGVGARSVRANRVIPESPATVLERLRVAAAAAPWLLEFDTLVGEHPAHGGVLRFTVPVIGGRHDESTPLRSLSRFAYHASRVGMLHVHVTVTPRGTASLPGCELTITGDLRSGERRSIAMYRTLAKGLAGLSAVLGTIVGAEVAGPAGAVAGFVLGSTGAFGYNKVVAAIARWEHRLAHRVLTAELDALLRRIQRPSDEARAFGPEMSASTPRLVRGSDAVDFSVRATLLPV